MHTAVLFAVLGASLGLASASSPSLPAIVNIGILFPRNETYNNATLFPVLLAVDNAQALFHFGPSIRWTISQFSALTETWGIAASGGRAFSGSEDPPADALDDNWVIGTRVTNQTVFREGRYKLEWRWGMLTCRGGTGDRITYVHGGTQATGEVEFAVVEDGSGTDVAFEGRCPTYSDTLIIEETKGGECPIMAGREDREEHEGTDMCDGRVGEVLSRCLMANITESGDRESCDLLLEQAQGGGGGEGGSDDDEDNDSNGDSSGDSNGEGDNGGVAVPSFSTASVLALYVLTWGLAHLLN